MSDPSEIELKFALTQEAVSVLAERLFGTADREDLNSIYFDTPGLALKHGGATLRLRHGREGWVQTLKAGGAGAVERFEDEGPAPDDALDLSRLSRAARDRLPNNTDALSPVFETRLSRRTVLVSRDGARIEVALDQGVIQAGDAVLPICELELELKSGEIEALLAMARDVAGLDGVSLRLESKAERGYRLAAGTIGQALKYQTPRLDFSGPATKAFQMLALAALQQLTANAELLRERPSLEAVHQARVGLRRLRTYVGAFKDWVADVRLPDIQVTLKRLTAIFEDARALDVFERDSFTAFARHEPGAAAFGHALLAVRDQAYRKVQDDVRDPAFAMDVFELAHWILWGPWLRTLSLAPDAGGRLDAAARKLLARRWRKLLRRGRGLDWSEPRARHKLRIEAKKMRYLSDGFRARGRRAVEALETLQSDLGALNDIATAPDAVRLALALTPPEAAFVGGAVVGERRSVVAQRAKAARRAFRKLSRQRRPRVR